MDRFETVTTALERVAREEPNKRRARTLRLLARLIAAVSKRGIPPEALAGRLDAINGLLRDDARRAAFDREYERLKLKLERDYRLVVPGHYRTQWLALGMALFGVPFGLIFGLALDNFGFVGIGLPMGMAIGAAIGHSRDRQAARDGRVLDVPEEADR